MNLKLWVCHAGCLQFSAISLEKGVALDRELEEHSATTAHFLRIEFAIGGPQVVIVHGSKGPLQQIQSPLTNRKQLVKMKQLRGNCRLMRKKRAYPVLEADFSHLAS